MARQDRRPAQTPRRYPVEPIARSLGITLGQPGRPDDSALHGAALLAAFLDVTTVTAHRYIRHGMPEDAADRAAIRLGLHPALVWPAIYELTDDEVDELDWWWGDDPPLDGLEAG